MESETARRLEKLELSITEASAQVLPQALRAFPVTVRQWGDTPLEVHGIYATNRGEFFFIDCDGSESPTVKVLQTARALDMIRLFGCLGAVGNRTALSDLVYGDLACGEIRPWANPNQE